MPASAFRGPYFCATSFSRDVRETSDPTSPAFAGNNAFDLERTPAFRTTFSSRATSRPTDSPRLAGPTGASTRDSASIPAIGKLRGASTRPRRAVSRKLICEGKSAAASPAIQSIRADFHKFDTGRAGASAPFIGAELCKTLLKYERAI
jgi:hypothetical protein